ncbi:SAM hydrolase/SAM-dependent halogenase family protein [Oceanobacillus kapialis]|uniref:S-adenosyl-l-methionine hydroxide adenosyltransferase family protein n=1 Tax=Oceanobacillus kapialis TaxID=481353 RepID=A0ABW5Q3P4_9BACI
MNKLVLQTDFGTSDGAVSAMYGVAISVNANLSIFDLTHDIPTFNIWEASYRLQQTVSYWPEETVFVSVVDPGVGSDRLSAVVKTEANQYIVTPDNGTLTHIKHHIGIKEVRKIDETINRLPKSGESYTFHGRDVYAYTGARLASKVITFEQVGPVLKVEDIVELPRPVAYTEANTIYGNIDILDIRFGNLWTNISRTICEEVSMKYGELMEVTIMHHDKEVYKGGMIFGRSFSDSRLGEPVVYVNSLDNLAVAINQGSFAETYQIETGLNWMIRIRKT